MFKLNLFSITVLHIALCVMNIETKDYLVSNNGINSFINKPAMILSKTENKFQNVNENSDEIFETVSNNSPNKLVLKTLFFKPDTDSNPTSIAEENYETIDTVHNLTFERIKRSDLNSIRNDEPKEIKSSYCYNTPSQCKCDEAQCVRKCCDENEVHIWNDTKFTCVKNEEIPFVPNVYDNRSDIRTTRRFVFIPNNKCMKYTLEEDEEFFLLSNGSLGIVGFEGGLDLSSYCLENTMTEQGTSVLMGFGCFVTVPKRKMFVAYSIGMLISVPFLIATFLVYAIVPELRNLHGKSLMCHVISLAIGYTFLAIVQIHNDLPSSLCVSFGFTILFSFLVCFFWLNVMCFDIWWTFSGFRGFRGSKRAAEHKKFILYSAYAWGSPILIIIIALILQFHPSVSDNWVRPRIGDVKCFLHDDALLEYFYGLMLALIICNLGFFIATALKIFRIHKDTAVLKRDDSQRHDSYENDRQRLNLYFKLFVVMGINWSLELISYFTGGPKWLWYVTDIGNTLQGALIFVIFVCKRNVWKLLVKRYHTLTGKPHLGHVSMTRTTGFSTQQSTASQSNGNKFTSIDSSY